MKYSSLILLALAVIFTGCEETIKLDINQAPPRVVIEGLLTNKPGYQAVKVSRTTDFYGSGNSPRVTDAVVTVTDDIGNEYDFVHNPNNDDDSVGIYIPAVPFNGDIGRTYTLHVQTGGTTYEATDKLLPVIAMDSLAFRSNPDEKKDPKTPGKFYEVLMYAHEPQDQTNYYLFKFYRNDSLTYYNDSDVYYSDDKFLAENINGISSPIYYALHDKARVDMFSLSRVGYVFYNDLSSLLTNDGGGMFGPIPITPRTNLSNGAIGFFQVSAVNTGEIMLDK
jgi:hypothetical protein